MALDISAIRRQFPILSKKKNGVPLVYLDSAATAQKPLLVLETMQQFFEETNANVHRGLHPLTEASTLAYENARTAVQTFLHAKYPEEIIFTKNCTESINIVAHGFIHQQDHVLLSILEHHSNIVPWMMQKAHLHWVDIDPDGNVNMKKLEELLIKEPIKLVAITGQSNVLGIRPLLKEIIQKAHDIGAKVLIDAAQLVAHHKIDVQELDCDFLAFSGHKLYGPTGVGILYGKRELMEEMPPLIGGGMMIKEVTRDGFTPADLPQKFEGGTPPIAQAIGLASAIEWFSQFDWKDIQEHEQHLLRHTVRTLTTIEDLTLLSFPREANAANEASEARSGCVSFVIDGVHPHDLTDILGQQGICLRAGHHCTMPLHKRLNIPASTRVSFGIYNMLDEIDMLVCAIQEAQRKLKM